MANSKKHKKVHGIVAAIFLLIAVLHLFRIIYNIPAQFGSWQVPMEASWIAMIVAGILAVILWNSKEK